MKIGTELFPALILIDALPQFIIDIAAEKQKQIGEAEQNGYLIG